MSEEKKELPLTDDLEVADLVIRFESGELPEAYWTHRSFLAVAVSYLHQLSFDGAFERMRGRLKRYLGRLGKAGEYHETTVKFFMLRIQNDIDAGTFCHYLYEEVDRLAGTCGMDLINEYYSSGILASDEARSAWVEPDLKMPDFVKDKA